MLKRLELVGFKSFADKTRFDFVPGITGIVGPNGSGKSNVVDAVRWILGEQSAKSLRGGEMADVIFNGSSSRKSLGMAEVTVTFDNSRRLLAVDADEVQFTRRVYRDGTGEYLINGQMSRLRDIKDIFLGSGAGSGGYTIIAQGRVDELLQASTHDRREIFDEAAGISRFKAKKTDALRKLATVEANLTRSKDRLDSLDAQLRTLRMQAAKAQKYQEYSARLRELRVGLGTREYRELTAALEVEQRELATLKEAVAGTTARAEDLERTARTLDWEVGKAEESLRHQEAKLAEARQQIAGFDATLKHERTVSTNQEAELLRAGRLRAELGQRVRSLEADVAQAATNVAGAEDRLRAVRDQADAAAAELANAAARVLEFDRELQAGLTHQMELVRRAGSARSAADASLAQVERLQNEYTRKLGEIDQKTALRSALEAALHGLSQADADLQARLAATRGRQAETLVRRDQLHAEQDHAQQALAALRVRQGDLRGRIEVLEGLEQAFEGLGTGVREVLARLGSAAEAEQPSDEHAPDAAVSAIVGLVADLLTVPRDLAPLVELALGDAAQRFVVRDPARMDAVAAALGELPGRVGFVPLVPVPPSHGSSADSLARVVSCEHPELAALPDQLLGNVRLVDSLVQARQLAADSPGCRIITRAGEILEPDGTLTIGPLKSGAGIVSRKSELRELRLQYRDLGTEVTAAEHALAGLRRNLDAVVGTLHAIETELGLLSGEAGDLQQKIVLHQQQVKHHTDHANLLRSEARILEDQVRQGEAAWLAAKQDADTAEAQAAELEQRIHELRAAIQAGADDRERLQQTHTAAQVELNRATAERDRLKDRLALHEADLRKRKIEAMDAVAAFDNARHRLAESLLVMLRATSGMSEAYAEKEARERQVAALEVQLAANRAQREQTRDELQALRAAWQGKQEAAHTRELAVHDLTAKLDAVVSRIRDDYGIELGQYAPPPEAAPEDTPPAEVPAIPDDLSAVHQEIEELRRKLARLGSVNMEALDELTRIETEFNSLQAQHDDLNAARKALQEVIDTINNDSRKLFTDTLNAVRGYFQELFRKLFGGGQADIVLEDPNDVLESGIEITARPPGKELRSLSLLSGG